MQTILVVDDNKDVLALIQKTLTREGYNVITAMDVIDALPHAAKSDLIVTDLNFPGLKGSDLAEMVKNTKKPIILITGETNHLNPCLHLFSSVLLKPFPRETLIDAVNNVFSVPDPIPVAAVSDHAHP